MDVETDLNEMDAMNDMDVESMQLVMILSL